MQPTQAFVVVQSGRRVIPIAVEVSEQSVLLTLPEGLSFKPGAQIFFRERPNKMWIGSTPPGRIFYEFVMEWQEGQETVRRVSAMEFQEKICKEQLPRTLETGNVSVSLMYDRGLVPLNEKFVEVPASQFRAVKFRFHKGYCVFVDYRQGHDYFKRFRISSMLAANFFTWKPE